jgi:hypothetical protein
LKGVTTGVSGNTCRHTLWTSTTFVPVTTLLLSKTHLQTPWNKIKND